MDEDDEEDDANVSCGCVVLRLRTMHSLQEPFLQKLTRQLGSLLTRQVQQEAER